MRKFRLLWVYGLLESAFVAIADVKMLSETDVHTKPQTQSPCTFMQIFLHSANPKLDIYT